MLKALHAAATLIQKHARARAVRRDFVAILDGRAAARAQHEARGTGLCMHMYSRALLLHLFHAHAAIFQARAHEDFAARVIGKQQRNRFMRTTLRDALGTLVDDRKTQETERRTHEQHAESAVLGGPQP